MGCTGSVGERRGFLGSAASPTRSSSSSREGRASARGGAAAVAARDGDGDGDGGGEEEEGGLGNWVGEWDDGRTRETADAGPVRALEVVAVRRRHHAASAMVVSADGRTAVVGHVGGLVGVVDVRTGRVVRELAGHSSVVRDVAMAATRPVLVTASDDKSVLVWDWRAGVISAELLRDHHCAIVCVSLSSDGTRMVSGAELEDPRVWDVAKGQTLHVLSPKGRGGASGAFRLRHCTVALCASGAVAATTHTKSSSSVSIWNADDGEFLREIRLDSALEGERRQSLALSMDGSLLVASTSRASVWDVQTCEVLARAPRVARSTSGVFFDADAEHVVQWSGFQFGSKQPYAVCVWHWRSSEPQRWFFLRFPPAKGESTLEMSPWSLVGVSAARNAVVLALARNVKRPLVAWVDGRMLVQDATVALLGKPQCKVSAANAANANGHGSSSAAQAQQQHRPSFDVAHFILNVDGDHAIWTRVAAFLVSIW